MKRFIPWSFQAILCPIFFLLFSLLTTPILACINKLEKVNQTQVEVDADDINDDQVFFEVAFSVDVSNKDVEKIRVSLEEGWLEQEYLNVAGKGTYEFTVLVAIPQGEKVAMNLVGVKKSGTECGNQSLTIDGTDFLVLPIELISFTGSEKAKGNLIQWATAYEDNVAYFSLESSTDGLSWKEIKDIPAVGFSSQIQSYEAMDADAGTVSYYRLRSVDFDGETQLSDLIVIERTNALLSTSLKAFPVPAVNQPVTIHYHTENATMAIVRLIDQSGRVVQQFEKSTSHGLNTLQIDLSQQAQGFYLLTILSNGNLQKTRLIKG